MPIEKEKPKSEWEKEKERLKKLGNASHDAEDDRYFNNYSRPSEKSECCGRLIGEANDPKTGSFAKTYCANSVPCSIHSRPPDKEWEKDVKELDHKWRCLEVIYINSPEREKEFQQMLTDVCQKLSEAEKRGYERGVERAVKEIVALQRRGRYDYKKPMSGILNLLTYLAKESKEDKKE